MLRGNGVEMAGGGRVIGCAPGYESRRNAPKYLKLVPRHGLWGWSRERREGQRMGRGGQKIRKGRGLGCGTRRGSGTLRGKGAIPSPVTTPPAQFDANEIPSSTSLPLPASPGDRDQQLDALKAQARATEQELRILGEKISRMHGYGRRSSHVAVVAAERCIGCGICAAVCPMDAITINGVARIETVRCAGCGACVDACVQEAITLRSV